MGCAGLLFALVGFSGKISALATKHKTTVLWLKRLELLDFSMESLGLALFLGFGILPLCIHNFDLAWGLGLCWGVLLVVWLIRHVKLFRREVATPEDDRNAGVSLIADPSRLSRRMFISGGIILGVGGAGLAAVWRARPALIPDYTFFGHDDLVSSLSWFPDSQRIASMGDNGRFFIWNAADGSNRRTLAHMGSGLTQMLVSPNGKLITLSDCRSISTVDAATRTVLWKKEIGYSGRPFGWAPDSAHMVVLSQSDVRIVDAMTGEEATTSFASPGNFTPQAIAWSPDGKLIAATEGMHIVLWDATSGVQHRTFALPPFAHHDISEFAWSPAGDALALAVGRVIYIWSLRSTEMSMVYREHIDSVPAISWSPDGRYIASCGSEDKSVRIWEAATGKTVFVYNGHFSTVQAVAWSPDGRRIASGGYDNLVHVWHPLLPA